MVHLARREICAAAQVHRYAFNYGGPLRESYQTRKLTSPEIFARTLFNVSCRPCAEGDWSRGPGGARAESADGQCTSPARVEVFHRRLELRNWFYAPCLVVKGFTPN
jgi:hypothetical protein